jgi:predicted flap endonuclease-1-like 5' DNA nuclease
MAESSETQGTDLPRAIASPATRALASVGITRLEQLAEMRESDLLKLHGMGPKAARILRETLAERGLSFAGEGEK